MVIILYGLSMEIRLQAADQLRADNPDAEVLVSVGETLDQARAEFHDLPLDAVFIPTPAPQERIVLDARGPAAAWLAPFDWGAVARRTASPPLTAQEIAETPRGLYLIPGHAQDPIKLASMGAIAAFLPTSTGAVVGHHAGRLMWDLVHFRLSALADVTPGAFVDQITRTKAVLFMTLRSKEEAVFATEVAEVTVVVALIDALPTEDGARLRLTYLLSDEHPPSPESRASADKAHVWRLDTATERSDATAGLWQHA